MFELYITENENVHRKVKSLIARHICGSFEIKTTENGKPYVDGDAVCFSLSHSRNTAVIALCDKPVGVDLEFIDGKKNFKSVLSRFSERERAEICGRMTEFFKNWVIKEAFIKFIGGTLGKDLKRLEYFGGRLYKDGEKQNVNIDVIYPEKDVICAICGGVTPFNGQIIRLNGEEIQL